jgi:hypothetical protein
VSGSSYTVNLHAGIRYKSITVQGRIDVGQVRMLSDNFLVRALNPDPLRLNSHGELGLAGVV